MKVVHGILIAAIIANIGAGLWVWYLRRKLKRIDTKLAEKKTALDAAIIAVSTQNVELATTRRRHAQKIDYLKSEIVAVEDLVAACDDPGVRREYVRRLLQTVDTRDRNEDG